MYDTDYMQYTSYIHICNIYKNAFQGIWAGKFKICRAGQQAAKSGAGSDAAVLRQNFFSKTSILLLRPFN